jgi:hypothetical protein
MGFVKGYTPWNKGKKHTEESKEKMVLHSSHHPAWNKGLPAWNKGKKGKQAWNKGLKNYLSGENSPVWKGGSSRAYKTGYYSNEYKLWRKAIFERDGYRCQVCEMIGGYLTAHHIKSFVHYPGLRFSLDNGITLCEKCHSLTDNYRRKNKSSKNSAL